MFAVLLGLWAMIGVSFGGGTTDLPPGFVPAPVISLDYVPKSATHRPDGDAQRRHPVEARLLFDQTHASAGKPFRVGVHLTQDKGWHTYWKSPGEVGLPTEVDLKIPEGATRTPMQMPVPSRFGLDGLISYGYDDQILLFTEVTLPESQPAGPVEIEASVVWLVCEVQCIRGTAELKRTIQVVADGQAAPSPSAVLFDAFASQHPVPVDQVAGLEVVTTFEPAVVPKEGKFTATVLVSGEGLQFNAETKLWPTFTPIIPGVDWGLQLDDEGKPIIPAIEGAPGAFKAVIQGQSYGPADPAKADGIGGLVMVKLQERWVRAEFMSAMPWEGAKAASDAVPVEVGEKGPPAPSPEGQTSAPMMLLMAFVGGLILNVMPCVLPVLSLKIYSVVEQTEADARSRQVAGIAYTVGVVLSFLALAGAIIVARNMFDIQLGWGQQFQSPVFIIVLATIVFAFGLSLFGVFEVPAFGATQLAGAQNQEGWMGHLLTGAFATVLATPCSAPFLGTGIGFAMSLPAAGLLLFFGVAGFGLALPFLLIAYVPAMVRFLPKPGAWMETFKQFMGFTLMATAVWLMDALGTQVGREGVFGFLVFTTAVAFACWILGRWAGPIASTRSKLIALAIAIAVMLGVGRSWLVFEPQAVVSKASGQVETELDFSTEIPWQPFSEKAIDDLAGKTVFIDFTADWCLSCKANEKTVLATDAVREAMAAKGVVPMMADFTRPDPTIQAWLTRFGRAGVPMYLVIPADRTKQTQVLPEILTVGLVVDAINKG